MGELRIDLHGPVDEHRDGTHVRFDGRWLRVSGPERDVLVLVCGRYAARARGSDLTFDLTFPPASFDGAFPPCPTEAVTHRGEIVPCPPAPGEPVTVVVRGAARRVEVVLAGTRLPMVQREPGIWTATLPGSHVPVRYSIEADGRPVADAAPMYLLPEAGTPWLRPPSATYGYVPSVPETPDWLRDAVIYHALVDRFAGVVREPTWLGHAGGTLRAMTERLDHVVALGADTLLVSPIHAGEMHVPYDVTDLFAVDPRLGTIDDVRTLCGRAHEIGLRLLLDLEVCWFGSRHPALREHPSWIRWLPSGRHYGWLDSRMLAALDHDDQMLRAHLYDAARFWLDAGFDGFRLDSAHDAPLVFWDGFPRDGALIGEVNLARDECLRYRGRLHGFLDLPFADTLRRFASGRLDAAAFDAAVRLRDALPDGLVAPAFLESHDIPRFDGPEASLRVALTLLMTLPQPPILYYGTEVGLRNEDGDDIDLIARGPMPWGDAQDLDRLAFVRSLVALRRAHPALRRGTRRTLLADGSRYSFERVLGDDRVVVTADADTVRIDL